MKQQGQRTDVIKCVSNSRLAAYAVVGTASMVACAASAEASIVTVDVNQYFNATGLHYQTAFFSLGGSNRFGLQHAATTRGSYGRAQFGIFGGGALIGNSSHLANYVSKLSAGANIAAGAFISANVGTMAFGHGFTYSQWTSPGQGYVGFKFNDAGGTEYGWASVTMNGADLNDFTLNSYAYTTAGELLQAGQVPEPSSLALLALGGAGLLAWRKRRASKVATALA